MAGQWLSSAHNEREDINSVLAADRKVVDGIPSPPACSSPPRSVHTAASCVARTPALSSLGCSSVEPDYSSPPSFVLPDSAYTFNAIADSAQAGAPGKGGGDEGERGFTECNAGGIGDSEFVIVENESPSEGVNPSRHHSHALHHLVSREVDDKSSVIALLIGTPASISTIRQPYGTGGPTVPASPAPAPWLDHHPPGAVTAAASACDCATAPTSASACVMMPAACGGASKAAARATGARSHGEEEGMMKKGHDQGSGDREDEGGDGSEGEGNRGMKVSAASASHIFLNGSAAELLASQLAAAALGGLVDARGGGGDAGYGGADGERCRGEDDGAVDLTVQCVVVDGYGDERGKGMQRALSRSLNFEASSASGTESSERQQCVGPAAVGPGSPTVVPVLVVAAREALAWDRPIPSTSAGASCLHTMTMDAPSTVRACTCQDADHPPPPPPPHAAADVALNSSSTLQPAALHVWRQAGTAVAFSLCGCVLQMPPIRRPPLCAADTVLLLNSRALHIHLPSIAHTLLQMLFKLSLSVPLSPSLPPLPLSISHTLSLSLDPPFPPLLITSFSIRRAGTGASSLLAL